MVRSSLKLMSAALFLASSASAFAGDVNLNGAGSSFVAPLVKRWVAEYEKINPTVKIDYASIGSGGGLKGIDEKTIDFAGSDAPMNRKALKAIGGAGKMVEFPSCAGGVVPAYNLPGIDKEIKFTGEILADIYAGKITNWNDSRIAKVNEGVTFPNLAITPAWRSDGSGTTFIFTNYLSTQSESFKETVGAGTAVKWPLGQGGKGNEGVTQVIQQTKGAIGYIEQGYADANKIPFGAVQNKAGKFVKSSTKTVSLAGASAKLEGNLLADSIWNKAGEEAYPISSFTYIIIYKDMANIHDQAKAQAMVDFLSWAIHDGQKYAEELDYAPLAPEVVAKCDAALKMTTFHGDALKH